VATGARLCWQRAGPRGAPGSHLRRSNVAVTCHFLNRWFEWACTRAHQFGGVADAVDGVGADLIVVAQSRASPAISSRSRLICSCTAWPIWRQIGTTPGRTAAQQVGRAGRAGTRKPRISAPPGTLPHGAAQHCVDCKTGALNHSATQPESSAERVLARNASRCIVTESIPEICLYYNALRDPSNLKY